MKELSLHIMDIIENGVTAGATLIELSIEEDRKENWLRISIKDNGKGITKEQIDSSKSFGLIGMRERVYFMGGRIQIKGSPNNGTTVSVEVPYKPGRGETC